LDAGELDKDLLRTCHFLHFGAVSLTDEPSRTATLEAARIAKEAGAIISYDPNYRPALWSNEHEARKYMLKAVEYADLVKVSEEELWLLAESEDFSKGRTNCLPWVRRLSLLLVVKKALMFSPEVVRRITVDTT